MTLGNITLSGGTDDLHDTFSMVNTDSMIESATLRDGTLTVASGQTLTLRGVTLDNVTLSGGTVRPRPRLPRIRLRLAGEHR